jgi:hypothetical protein
MCHHAHVHVRLSAEEKKATRKLAGIMIPVYASVLLAVIAVVALTGAPRESELIVASPASTATR